jgi:very-short-patch-repair endonuclease
MKNIIHYNHALKELARRLRNNSTLSEILLWKELKSKKMRGYDFHRQKPVDKYIVDFYCPRLHLAIEIDGVSHFAHQSKDRLRQKNIEALGIHFLRFDDSEVKRDMKGVLKIIEEWIDNFEFQNQIITSTLDGDE